MNLFHADKIRAGKTERYLLLMITTFTGTFYGLIRNSFSCSIRPMLCKCCTHTQIYLFTKFIFGIKSVVRQDALHGTLAWQRPALVSSPVSPHQLLPQVIKTSEGWRHLAYVTFFTFLLKTCFLLNFLDYIHHLLWHTHSHCNVRLLLNKYHHSL